MTPVVQSWPTAVDYQTALQVPELCFNEERLQKAEVKCTPLGLPMAATGNVVVVFRLTLPDGQEAALRCFTRKQTLQGMALRYELLNRHFAAFPLPVLVPSEFLPNAVMVEGEWYPASLMPWVKGRQLHLFIEDHLDAPDTLLSAATRWRALMEKLRAAQFAHGDLSDGNVLVDDDGEIRLIDFDAAYIPALQHITPSEIGKPNYQHPDRLRRDAKHYGYYAPNVDAFAALVIDLSLRAVAADPTLWELYNMGDNLIFVQNDYENPGSTPIWPHLQASKDKEVRRLTALLERYCHASLPTLPFLEEAVRGHTPQPAAGVQPPVIQVPRAPSYRDEGDLENTVVINRPSVSPQKGAPVPVGPAPPRPSRPRPDAAAPWRKAALAVVGAVMVLAVAATVMWSPWEDTAASGVQAAALHDEGAPAQPVAGDEGVVDEGAITADDIIGFYTGYTTLPDGSREALGLTIDPATGTDGRFSFSINSRLYQYDGTGTYNILTGIVDLENQYLLLAQLNERGEVVLTSLPEGAPNPLMKVRKSAE